MLLHIHIAWHVLRGSVIGAGVPITWLAGGEWAPESITYTLEK